VLGEGKTDKQGRFKLSVLVPAPAARYEVAAVAGAAGLGLGWQPVGAGSDLAIRLPAEQAIRGRLIDLQGQPAANVPVAVTRVGSRAASGQAHYLAITLSGALDGEEEELTVEEATGKIVAFTPDGKNMMGPGKGKQPAAQAIPALSFRSPPEGLPFWPTAVTTDAEGRFTLRGLGAGQGAGLLVRDGRFAAQVLDLAPRDKGKPGEVTLALAPARTLEGTVVDAASRRPVPFARVRVDGPGSFGFATFTVAGIDRAGADWKGRRGLGDSAVRLFALDGGSFGDDLPGAEARADKDGRFRLNLHLADSYTVRLTGPDGAAYLPRAANVPWPKGAARQQVEFTLPPGVPVRGKVVDKATGRPVAGARVDFWSKGLQLPEGVRFPGAVKTDQDGMFKALLPPAPWHLVVNAATAGYAVHKIESEKLTNEPPPAVRLWTLDGKLAFAADAAAPAHFFYPDAWLALDLKAGADPAEVAVALRPAAVLRGRLLGPDGKPVLKGRIFQSSQVPYDRSVWAEVNGPDRSPLDDLFANHRLGPTGKPVEVRNGNFELTLREPEAEYRLFCLDARNQAGAWARFTAAQAEKEPVTVRLAPCGSAAARFVDDRGQPLAQYRPLLWTLLTPESPVSPRVLEAVRDGGVVNRLGSAAFSPDGKVLATARRLSAVDGPATFPHAVWVGAADPLHYGDGPRTDAEGRVTLPALIPGATYRLIQFDGQAKDFTAESGKTLDLKDIPIKQPDKTAKLPVLQPPK
jgi:hypothetical protein